MQHPPVAPAPHVQQLMWIQSSDGAACKVAHAVHACLEAAHVARNEALNDAVSILQLDPAQLHGGKGSDVKVRRVVK